MNYDSFYTTASAHYNFSRLDDDAVFNYTLKYICNQLGNKYLSILDIGCGTGEYGFRLSQEGYKVIGIDKSYEQVEIASKRISAFQDNVLSLKQQNDSFDAVLLIMVIHQLDADDLDCAFDEVARILKPGGIVIVRTCFNEDISNRFTSKYFPSCYEFDSQRFPSLEKIVSAASKLNLIAKNKSSIEVTIPKNILIQKFRLRGASNIGMLSNEELERGIDNIINDYEYQDAIKMSMDNSFLVFKKHVNL